MLTSIWNVASVSRTQAGNPAYMAINILSILQEVANLEYMHLLEDIEIDQMSTAVFCNAEKDAMLRIVAAEYIKSRGCIRQWSGEHDNLLTSLEYKNTHEVVKLNFDANVASLEDQIMKKDGIKTISYTKMRKPRSMSNTIETESIFSILSSIDSTLDDFDKTLTAACAKQEQGSEEERQHIYRVKQKMCLLSEHKYFNC